MALRTRYITMVDKFTAAVAANRFGLGARPGEIDRMAHDPRGALRSQLQGGAPLIHNEALSDTPSVLSRAAQLRAARREHRRADAVEDVGADSSSASIPNNSTLLPPGTVEKLSGFFRGIYVDEAVARMRGLSSPNVHSLSAWCISGAIILRYRSTSWPCSALRDATSGRPFVPT